MDQCNGPWDHRLECIKQFRPGSVQWKKWTCGGCGAGPTDPPGPTFQRMSDRAWVGICCNPFHS